MRKGDIVCIWWRDIVVSFCEEEELDTIVAVSVGRVERTGRTVVLCSGWYEDEDNWAEKERTAIPKGCIEKVEVLRDRSL